MIGTPATKISEWAKFVGDETVLLSDFELEGYVRKIRAEIPKLRDSSLAGRHKYLAAVAIFRLGRWREALEGFTAARLLHAPAAEIGRSAALVEMREYAEAYDSCVLAVQEQPDNPVAIANLAEVLHKLGLREEAHEAYRVAREEFQKLAASPLMIGAHAFAAAAVDMTLDVNSSIERLRGLLGQEYVAQLLLQRRWRQVRRHVEASEGALGPRGLLVLAHDDGTSYADSASHAAEAALVLDAMHPLRAAAVETRGGHDDEAHQPGN